ncbi:MAG: patatin-like phospholipase family protein [Ectothiorhodospiraceae bacterium]|nr:patatin-like phospholipase family protein [Chromatiales bacterium]MCP5154890.1 patatin-like phospholipase family protein [Ectothiorhodospiraceae bacterium]
MSAQPTDKLVRFLSAVTFFRDLDPAVLAKVVPRLRRVHLGAGRVLMHEGDPGNTLYVVVNGRLGVTLNRGADDEMLVEIGRGELVGEMAVLADAPRSVTVRAVRDSFLLELSKKDFFVLVQRYPRALLGITRLLVERLQRSMHAAVAAASPMRTVAVVPAGAGADLERFSGRLAAALREFGTAVAINRDRIQSQLRHLDAVSAVGDRLVVSRDRLVSQFVEPSTVVQPGSEIDSETTQWLHNLEASQDFVVYQADTEASPWTQRCCRQADRILLVGWAKAKSKPNEIERMLGRVSTDGAAIEGGLAKVDLVLLHPGGDAQPSGTAEWLRQRRTQRVHHVSVDSDADMLRLCRVLLDRHIGLVLSGGGARGVAHIGVLRALEERGIQVDAVGGSSFGAIMGAGIALGWNAERLRHGVREALVEAGGLLDHTVPLVSVARGRRATERIRRMYGDVAIEDLRLPFFCISSNLTRGAVTAHTTGTLWQALRASVAIPGIFPPMRSPEGDVLVDGAIMNNLPVDVMRSMMGGGRILAVNLRGPVEIPSDDLPENGALSGWPLLWRKLVPFADPAQVPGLVEIIMRTAESGNVISTQRADHEADLSFKPDVSEFSLLNFRHYERIIEAGYREAAERLEKWSELAPPDPDRGPPTIRGSADEWC